MSWETFNTIAVWACALGAITCTVAVTWLANVNRHAHAATMQALQSMSDTHMMGFEALTIDIDRLNARVAALEER